MTLRHLIDPRGHRNSPDALYEALYDVNLTEDDVTDALFYASQRCNIIAIQAILKHPFHKCTMRPAPAQTRSLWTSALKDDPSSLATTLDQHSFSAEELRDVLLEAGTRHSYRFLDQYVRQPKVCVDVHSASGENILTILLQQLQKDKTREEVVLKLINAIGEKVKEEQAEKRDVDPATDQQLPDSKNVVQASQETNAQYGVKHKQPKCIFAGFGDRNSSLHLAIRCGSLPIVKSLMKYRDEIIHTSIVEESPRIDLISTALYGNDVRMICYILSHATKFFDDNDNAAERICNKRMGFSEEEKSVMLESVIKSASSTNKLASAFTSAIFKYGKMSCLKILIEQKFINTQQSHPLEYLLRMGAVAPNPQESHSLQYLLRIAYLGKVENLRLLLANRHDLGIDINTPTFSALSLPTKSRPVRVALRENIDSKFTLLQVSMRTGQVGRLEALLENGADTTSTDPHGLPLICHNMKSKNCMTCLKLLLREGCDLAQTFVLKDSNCQQVEVSLIDYYLACSDIFMVQMLFELGASKFRRETDRAKFNESETLQVHHHLKSIISDDEMSKFKEELVGEVHTLYKLCRNVVRKTLDTNVEKKIQSLIVPMATKKFLNLEELEDMQENYNQFKGNYMNKRRTYYDDDEDYEYDQDPPYDYYCDSDGYDS